MPLFDFGKRKASKIGPVSSQWVAAIAAIAALLLAALISVYGGVNYWLVLALAAPVTYAVTHWLFLRRDGGTRL